MTRQRFQGVLTALAVMAAAATSGSSTIRAQQPQFRSSVEVTSIDVTVLDGRGQPITDLQASDFTVRLDGAPRRIISAKWVALRGAEAPRRPAIPEGYSTNEGGTGGRLIVVAVDQPNIRFGGTAEISRTVGAFIDRLEPSDRIAAVGLGHGNVATPFTADRKLVKDAVARMSGQDKGTLGLHNVALSEAIDIDSGQQFVIDAVTTRECGECSGAQGAELLGCKVQLQVCQGQVLNDARLIAHEAHADGQETIVSLRALLRGLTEIEGPKTLVLVSEGFVIRDRSEAIDIGSMASAAQTSLYVLKLEDFFTDVSVSRPQLAQGRDRQVRREPLEMLALGSRGALFNVTGSGSGAFQRLEAELAGYYLLAVESDVRDRDGKQHGVNVQVSRRGSVVRARHQMTPAGRPIRRNRRDAAVFALSSPLLVAGLPLHVATFSLRGPETSKIQLLIHADVGTDYASAMPVSLAYLISDSNGRVVASQVADERLMPVASGVPSPLQFTGGASLDPGEYTLKLAAAEGDRAGSLEHPIHAGLVDAAGVTLSELMVGGPMETRELLQPTIGHRVSFGMVHGYVEAYGADSGKVHVKYEIAPEEPGAPALLDAEVAGRPAGGERSIFTSLMPVRQLPPGKYFLRAVVSGTGGIAKTIARAFEVAPPAVLTASAVGTGAVADVPRNIFLPVADSMLARPFRREDAARGETLGAFRERVSTGARAAFDRGAALLTLGNYVEAERSFKNAVQIDVDSGVALAYLAATYAASGHDAEATSAWRTSLIDGSDFPQIYEWLGDALLRHHALGEARVILEEAIQKWPDDPRFTLPLALVYATLGQGREAVRTLERHLAGHSQDQAAQLLGVEWIYHLRSAGALAHTVAEDLKLAQGWADAYIKSKGQQAALVRQWMQFIERSGK